MQCRPTPIRTIGVLSFVGIEGAAQPRGTGQTEIRSCRSNEPTIATDVRRNVPGYSEEAQ